MVRFCVRAALLAAALLGLAAVPAPAAAPTRLGPDLAGAPYQPGGSGGFAGAACSPSVPVCWHVNVPLAGSSLALEAPFTGVLTRWRFRAGCCSENTHPAKTMTLRTFDRGFYDFNPSPSVKPAGTGPSFVVPENGRVDATSVVDLPARLPITQGQRFGIQADTSIGFSLYAAADTALGIGEKAPDSDAYPERYLYTINGYVLAFNADLERDADGDGRGDETQDCWPTDPSRYGPCAGTTPTPPASVPPLVAGKGSPPGTPPPTSAAVFPLPVVPGGPLPPASASGGAVFIPVACPPGAKVACGGYLILSLPKPGQKPRLMTGAATAAAAPSKLQTVGKRRYSLKPGAKAKLKIRLSKSAKRLLVKKRKLTFYVTIKPDKGKAKRIKRTIKLPKRKPRPKARP